MFIQIIPSTSGQDLPIHVDAYKEVTRAHALIYNLVLHCDILMHSRNKCLTSQCSGKDSHVQ